MAAIRLSAVSKTHAPVLAVLHEAAFSRRNEAAWSADAFTALLALPATFGFLAQDDDEPIGFILCAAAGGECEIYTLAVAPSHQRRGHARALLDRAKQEALKRDAKRMILEVARDNAPALRLYRNSGFSQAATRPGYYQKGGGTRTAPAVDALIMVLDLED